MGRYLYLVSGGNAGYFEDHSLPLSVSARPRESRTKMALVGKGSGHAHGMEKLSSEPREGWGAVGCGGVRCGGVRWGAVGWGGVGEDGGVKKEEVQEGDV
jgi:hypothetical protein